MGNFGLKIGSPIPVKDHVEIYGEYMTATKW